MVLADQVQTDTQRNYSNTPLACAPSINDLCYLPTQVYPCSLPQCTAASFDDLLPILWLAKGKASMIKSNIRQGSEMNLAKATFFL